VWALQRLSRAAGDRGGVAVDSRRTVGSMLLSMWLQCFVVSFHTLQISNQGCRRCGDSQNTITATRTYTRVLFQGLEDA